MNPGIHEAMDRDPFVAVRQIGTVSAEPKDRRHARAKIDPCPTCKGQVAALTFYEAVRSRFTDPVFVLPPTEATWAEAEPCGHEITAPSPGEHVAWVTLTKGTSGHPDAEYHVRWSKPEQEPRTRKAATRAR